MCIYVYDYVCVWNPELSNECFPRLLSTFIFYFIYFLFIYFFFFTIGTQAFLSVVMLFFRAHLRAAEAGTGVEIWSHFREEKAFPDIQ